MVIGEPTVLSELLQLCIYMKITSWLMIYLHASITILINGDQAVSKQVLKNLVTHVNVSRRCLFNIRLQTYKYAFFKIFINLTSTNVIICLLPTNLSLLPYVVTQEFNLW